MVGITGVVSIIFLLIGMSLIFYLVVEKSLSTMFEVQIFEDEEELINIFKNGLRNSCWKHYEDNEDNASR